MSEFVMPLLLATFAGLATTVGSLLALVLREPSRRFMALALGFAAGVMVLVSFAELMTKAVEAIGFGPSYLLFFLGFGAMFALDYLLPHAYEGIPDAGMGVSAADPRLLRLGLFCAIGIGIHNFPEGMATFAGALADPKLGFAIAAAIALHNIPEGIAVSAPVFAATGSRSKAFWWSFLSGVAEPLGALLAALVLLPFLRESLLAGVLAVVAGFMVFIALDELLPAARDHGSDHLAITGAAFGMAVMAASLWLFTR
jgi:ZIP family zinc transporter